MAGMNPFLAELYKTTDTIEKNASAQMEKTAQEQLLDELEKAAAAEGIDLNEFSDEEIAGILNEVVSADPEKTAGADLSDEDQAKLAEADVLGRTMAHAFYQELSTIQSGGDQVGSEAFRKTASFEGEEIDPELVAAIEDAAVERANAILYMLDGQEVKTSSISVDDEELDEIVGARAAELLDENGYDVEAISQALAQE